MSTLGGMYIFDSLLKNFIVEFRRIKNHHIRLPSMENRNFLSGKLWYFGSTKAQQSNF